MSTRWWCTRRGGIALLVVTAIGLIPATPGAASPTPAAPGDSSTSNGISPGPVRDGANTRGDLETVAYQGRSFTVPRSWPVVDLTRQPATCVRFDRHAVYLGKPGTDQACPAHLVGTTEAILIEPASASAQAQAVEDVMDRTITAWDRVSGLRQPTAMTRR